MVPGNTTKFFLVLSALVTSLYGWYRPLTDMVESLSTVMLMAPQRTSWSAWSL
ncbi:MAG: hypothetical protein GX576_14915 [Thauera phenolivorans]|uniref:Uncharacterized protein n=1 Tax=Thauera phenolivorans TaxID=1792543 RepID=A0A7X7LYM9_9RHOO|nr:hypothetical protein [Thauera phenolivorans]